MKAGLYKTCAGVIAIACAVAIPVVAAASTTPISNLIVRPQGDFVELTIIGGGHAMCENFTEPAEDGRPFRIVLDFCDADHALGQQNFSALPMSQIARIRTSQYATTPQHVVRIVLDMRGEVTYTTRAEGSSMVVRFVDPNRTFAAWEANPNAAPTMAVNTPPATKTATPKESKPEPKATPAPAVQNTKPTASAKPEELVPHERQKSQTQVVVGAAPENMTPESPTDAPMQTDKPAVAETPSTSSSPVAKSPNSYATPQVPLVFAPQYLDGNKPEATETPTRDFAISKESLTPQGPQPSTPAERAQADNEAAEAMWASTTGPRPSTKSADQGGTSNQAAAESETGAQPTGTLLDRLKTKFFGDQVAPRPYTTVDDASLPGAEQLGPPTPSNNLDREALLERIRQTEQRVAAGGSGDLLGEEGGAGGIPTRAMLHYDDMGRRDPFQPLVTGMRSGFVTDQLPDIETLRLVGVLHDDIEALALLENVEGYSYILRTGDPVQNGKLIAVQGDRALFRIEDYGWSHVVALQLTPRGADPSKALGLAPRNYPKYDDEEQDQNSNSTDKQGSDGE